MRDKKPFNLPALFPDSFLEITAKLIVHDRPIREIPFAYVGAPVNRFQPVITHFKWQTVKEIEVFIEIEYLIHSVDTGHSKGHYKASAKWAVNYEKNGITVQTIKVTPLEQRAEGDFAVHVDINVYQPSLVADVSNTLLDLTLIGGYTDNGMAVSYRGAGANIGGSHGTYLKTYEFFVSQFAIGRPAQPIQLPEHLLKHDIFFEKEDQPQISVDELRRLEDKWSDPLRKEAPELAAAIQAGTCLLILTGHASVTGRSKEYNLALSAKRITSVADAIKSTFKSNKIAFVEIPKGQMDATQGGPAPQEKRVEIVIGRR